MRYFFIVLFLAAMIVSSYADTEVSGEISEDTIWDISGSPYIVTDDIFVNTGIQLKIDPGVHILFCEDKKLTVKGEIIAEGTSTSMIVFTSEDQNLQWSGIKLDHTSSSRFSFCDISKSKNSGIILSYSNNITISDCYIHNNFTEEIGGGICSDAGEQNLIRNNLIYDNHANLDGGGICIRDGSDNLIEDNTIHHNTAGFAGGGIYLKTAANIEGNEIFNNFAWNTGGGIYATYWNTNRVFKNNIIYNNEVRYSHGGGIYIYGESYPLMENCEIYSNTTTQGNGGGIYFNSISPTIINFEVYDNEATYGYGGGIYLWEAKPQIEHSIIRNNKALKGGAMYLSDTVPYEGEPLCRLTSCDIINNEATTICGGIYVENRNGNYEDLVSNFESTNSIIANNSGYQIFIDLPLNNQIYISLIKYTCIYPYQIYWQGNQVILESIIKKDPQLAISDESSNLGQYNYHLLETSPCIDAGDPTSTCGDVRIDIGCYETTTDIKKTEHNHYNWVSFPRLNRNNNDFVIANDVLDDYIDWPFNLKLYYILPEPVLIYNPPNWLPSSYDIRSSYAYKLNPQDANHLYNYLPLEGTRLPEDYELTYTIQPNQYEWLGYWIPKTQNIRDAFGDFWDYVEKVKAEDWYYDRQTIISKDGEISNASSSTNNKNMEYGKGYMVWFKDTPIEYFHWTNSGLFATSVKKEKPENFTYTDKPDYEVIDIVDISPDIREIGVFKDDECVGAVVVKDSCEQILVYSDNINRVETPYNFEIIRERGKKNIVKTYEVFNFKSNSFEPGIVIAGKQEHSIIKFSDLEDNENIPENKITELYSNYPNPFNPETKISFSLSHQENVALKIYNIKGQLVKTLFSGVANRGKHTVIWNGTNKNGKKVTSGIYLYKLITKEKSISKKMLMLK